MQMSLSRKEIEELRPRIERVVQDILGFSEQTLVTAAINCLEKGYSRKEAAGEELNLYRMKAVHLGLIRIIRTRKRHIFNPHCPQLAHRT